MKYQKTGSCLCGKCEFSFESNTLSLWVCHCDSCKKWTGWPGMWLHIDGKLEFKSEEYLKWFPSSEWGMRGFCSECGSSLVWGMQDRSMVLPFAGALDDSSWIEFTDQLFIDKKPAYFEFANKTQNMTSEEFYAKFG